MSSALPSNSDIARRIRHVSKVPIADSCTAANMHRHSITSSARASKDGGRSRPSACAGLRLITSSNLVGACAGSSPGLAPHIIGSSGLERGERNAPIISLCQKHETFSEQQRCSSLSPHHTRPHRLESRQAAAYGHRRILRTRSYLWSSSGLSGQSRINKVLPRSSLALQQLACYQPSSSSSCAPPKVEIKYFQGWECILLIRSPCPVFGAESQCLNYAQPDRKPPRLSPKSTSCFPAVRSAGIC
jgi:hypothetical protein